METLDEEEAASNIDENSEFSKDLFSINHDSFMRTLDKYDQEHKEIKKEVLKL